MPQASDRRPLKEIKPSGAVLQAAFESAFAKPNKPTQENLAALYFHGSAENRPVIVKGSMDRPRGNFFMGGSEPVNSTKAGKKIQTVDATTAELLYGNYGRDK